MKGTSSARRIRLVFAALTLCITTVAFARGPESTHSIWSSTEYFTLNAYYLGLSYFGGGEIDVYFDGKTKGFSVRCLKD